jgi:hypothetical protein
MEGSGNRNREQAGPSKVEAKRVGQLEDSVLLRQTSQNASYLMSYAPGPLGKGGTVKTLAPTASKRKERNRDAPGV